MMHHLPPKAALVGIVALWLALVAWSIACAALTYRDRVRIKQRMDIVTSEHDRETIARWLGLVDWEDHFWHRLMVRNWRKLYAPIAVEGL